MGDLFDVDFGSVRRRNRKGGVHLAVAVDVRVDPPLFRVVPDLPVGLIHRSAVKFPGEDRRGDGHHRYRQKEK